MEPRFGEAPRFGTGYGGRDFSMVTCAGWVYDVGRTPPFFFLFGGGGLEELIEGLITMQNEGV